MRTRQHDERLVDHRLYTPEEIRALSKDYPDRNFAFYHLRENTGKTRHADLYEARWALRVVLHIDAQIAQLRPATQMRLPDVMEEQETDRSAAAMAQIVAYQSVRREWLTLLSHHVGTHYAIGLLRDIKKGQIAPQGALADITRRYASGGFANTAEAASHL